jgi:hypothetical protein
MNTYPIGKVRNYKEWDVCFITWTYINRYVTAMSDDSLHMYLLFFTARGRGMVPWGSRKRLEIGPQKCSELFFTIYRCVLFTIKLLHKWFEFLGSFLMPYWLGLYILRWTCRQNRLYGTLFHTVIILSKHHHHHYHHYRGCSSHPSRGDGPGCF